MRRVLRATARSGPPPVSQQFHLLPRFGQMHGQRHAMLRREFHGLRKQIGMDAVRRMRTEAHVRSWVWQLHCHPELAAHWGGSATAAPTDSWANSSAAGDAGGVGAISSRKVVTGRTAGVLRICGRARCKSGLRRCRRALWCRGGDFRPGRFPGGVRRRVVPAAAKCDYAANPVAEADARCAERLRRSLRSRCVWALTSPGRMATLPRSSTSESAVAGTLRVPFAAAHGVCLLRYRTILDGHDPVAFDRVRHRRGLAAPKSGRPSGSRSR